MRWLDFLAGYMDARKDYKREGQGTVFDNSAYHYRNSSLKYSDGYNALIVKRFAKSINL